MSLKQCAVHVWAGVVGKCGLTSALCKQEALGSAVLHSYREIMEGQQEGPPAFNKHLHVFSSLPDKRCQNVC